MKYLMRILVMMKKVFKKSTNCLSHELYHFQSGTIHPVLQIFCKVVMFWLSIQEQLHCIKQRLLTTVRGKVTIIYSNLMMMKKMGLCLKEVYHFTGLFHFLKDIGNEMKDLSHRGIAYYLWELVPLPPHVKLLNSKRHQIGSEANVHIHFEFPGSSPLLSMTIVSISRWSQEISLLYQM